MQPTLVCTGLELSPTTLTPKLGNTRETLACNDLNIEQDALVLGLGGQNGWQLSSVELEQSILEGYKHSQARGGAYPAGLGGQVQQGGQMGTWGQA